VSLAVAPTPSAALMFARSNEELLITDIATLKQRLCALPITSLDCPEPVLETLRDLGMQRIGEVLRLPRDGLAKRFGPGFIDQLDRALGQRPDPQTPFVITEHFSSRLDLPVPVAEVQALLFGAKRLSMTLAGWLTGRGLGVMRVKLELLHEDHPASIIELNLSAPSRDPLHLSTLTRERLERIRLPGRVEALVLSSIETAALSGRNASLFPDLQASEDSALYERLAARLGENAVLMLRPYADHRPERAWRNERTLAADKHYRTPAARPLWLLPSPVPLSEFLHEAHPRLVLADGPERIESGWWEGKDVRRDYFVARARDGQTLWLFRDAASSASWYVHGIFS
jgi:protein ImuB